MLSTSDRVSSFIKSHYLTKSHHQPCFLVYYAPHSHWTVLPFKFAMGRSPRYRSAQQEPLYVTGRWRWSGPCGHLRPTPIVPRLLHAQYGIPCHAEAGQRLLSGGRTQSRPTGNTRGGLRRCDAAPATPTRQDATAHGGVARLHLRDTALRRPSGHTGLQARPALLPLQLWWRPPTSQMA